MAKVTQALLILVGVFVAAKADAAGEKQAQCALDGAKSVSDMSKIAVRLWAATQRCGKKPKGNVLSPKCEVDIAEAIQAVNDMIMVIVSAAKDCGSFSAENYECGMAVGKLTSAAAGLAANGGQLVADCPHAKSIPASTDPGLDTATTVGKCLVDAQDSMGSLFEASQKLSKVTRNCQEGGHKCSHNALYIVSAFSSMGSALAGAVDDCSSIKGKGNTDAACASSVLGAVDTLHGLANAGIGIAEACKVPASRLYELEEENDEPSNMPFLLAAFLPISAVVSFFAGSRFANHRSQDRAARDYDRECLVSVEE